MALSQPGFVLKSRRIWAPFSLLAALWEPRTRHVHLREMPEHVLRDIGILDGNDPRGKHR